MPGAWELKQQNSVLVAIIHVDTTTVAWAFGLRNLIIPGPHPVGLAGMPYDMARNVACRYALEAGVDWIFFLDSDVVVPNDAILRLMAHRQPFISGLYCRRSPPHGVPVMMRGGQWVTKWPANQVIEVDVVGAGCLLISRQLLEKCPPQRPGKPWFDWRVDMQGILPPEDCMSEDFTLCQWLRKQSLAKILVDTSVKCRHIGYGEATYGRFEPCNATPVT